MAGQPTEAKVETPYRVLTTDGIVRKFTIMWPKEPNYELIAELVEPLLGGRAFEHVSVLHEGRACDLFVDDVGQINKLPRNELATKIYRARAMKLDPNLDPESLNWIAGPAVLFMRRVWF